MLISVDIASAVRWEDLIFPFIFLPPSLPPSLFISSNFTPQKWTLMFLLDSKPLILHCLHYLEFFQEQQLQSQRLVEPRASPKIRSN